MKKEARLLGVCFCLLTLSGAALSSSNIPLFFKLPIFLLGVLGPTLWAGLKIRATGRPAFEGLPSVPLAFLMAWVGFTFFSRFYRLENWVAWPNPEEGVTGLEGLDLAHHWTWQVFYGFGQVPPLSIWAAALLFKAGISPVMGLWLPAAMASVAVVGVGFLAFRQFFPTTFAVLGAGWLAASYWPFFLGRICCQGDWIVLWTCTALLFLGRFLKAHRPSDRNRQAVWLGLVLGTGFFTSAPWPFVVLWSGGLAVWSVGKEKGGKKNLLYLAAAFLAALSPFAAAVWREGYGAHIQAMSLLNGWVSWPQKLFSSFSYLTILFWGSLAPDAAYPPPSGGFLNPIQGALVWLGIAEWLRFRREARCRAAAAAFGLFLLPGMLSMNTETFRIVQLIPVLAVATAMGASRLIRAFPRVPAWVGFSILLAASACVDGIKFSNANPDPLRRPAVFAQDRVRFEEWASEQLFKKAAAHDGPGLVLDEFLAAPHPTLSLMSGGLGEGAVPPAWAAILMDPHYVPFLAPRLSGSHWIGMDAGDGSGKGFVVGLIPSNEKNGAFLRSCEEMEPYFKKLNRLSEDVYNSSSYAAAERAFESPPKALTGNRFLTACYWERRGEFYYDYGFQKHYQDHVDALRRAIREGYPAAHLYFKLGSLLLRKGERTKAREAFQKALRADPKLVGARVGLEMSGGGP